MLYLATLSNVLCVALKYSMSNTSHYNHEANCSRGCATPSSSSLVPSSFSTTTITDITSISIVIGTDVTHKQQLEPSMLWSRCIISYDQPQLRSSKMEISDSGGWNYRQLCHSSAADRSIFWCGRWIKSRTILWASFDKLVYRNNPYFRLRNYGQDSRNCQSRNQAADRNYEE